MFHKLGNLFAQSTKKNDESNDTNNMKLNSESLKNLLSDNIDVVVKHINISNNTALKATLFYINGMVDVNMLDNSILKPLQIDTSIGNVANEDKIIYNILNGGVCHANTSETDNLIDCVTKMINGAAALVFDAVNKAVIFHILGYEMRNVTEPTNENVTKGSKEAFVELINVNTALVRRKIRTHKLKIQQVIVGKQTITPVAIIFIDGLTNMNIVNDLRQRLEGINVDGALMVGNIEEYIIDDKFTLFPQISYSERVDAFSGNLLEGRVGILIDGIPIGISIPVTLDVFFRSPDDYTNNYIVDSGIRLVRYLSALISLALPAFYIAITTFHQEMIPSKLAEAIIASKEGVPFPVFLEILMLMLSFEIITEAGLRLPKSIGQALSIVGALIVGDAAVTAKIVSPAIVIIVALTAICGFVVPKQDMSNALRVSRLFLVLLSSIFGLYGLSIGILFIGIHISQLNSFGVPYMAPYTSTQGKGLFGDSLLRPPLPMLKIRPENLKTTNKKRQQ